MPHAESQLYAVIGEVRTCFNLLKTLAERLHRDAGVNASMRAVMEALAVGPPRTVPDIASARGVSRQHIQTVMNGLVDEGLAVASDNPAHKRSPLYDLTPKGRATFAAITAHEAGPLKDLAAAMDASALEQAGQTLADLNRVLSDAIAREHAHDTE